MFGSGQGADQKSKLAKRMQRLCTPTGCQRKHTFAKVSAYGGEAVQKSQAQLPSRVNPFAES